MPSPVTVREWICWHLWHMLPFNQLILIYFYVYFFFCFVFLAWLFIGSYDGNFPHRVSCCSRVRVPGTGTVLEEQQVHCWPLVTIIIFHDALNHWKMKPTFTLLPRLQTDSLLLIRPYISKLTLSEMHAVMTAGLAGISGTMMGVYISFGVRVMRGEEGRGVCTPGCLC